MKDRIALCTLYLVLCTLSIVLCLSGCREYQLSDDPTMRLAFSHDTVCFDTFFTQQGSATFQLMVYNPNPNALLIDRVWLDDNQAFKVNVDGEPQLDQLTNLQLNGGDSLFVFIRVEIDPLNSNNPVLVTDQLHFHLATGATQQVQLEAYGQNVKRLGGSGVTFVNDYTFTNVLPYLIRDTFVVKNKLTIEKGARLYMHRGACLYAYGDIEAAGTLDEPIIFCGDRLDNLFDSVPYRFAGGSWNGIYVIDTCQTAERQYSLDYVDILSGNIGLYCACLRNNALPTVRLNGCRIHNHSLYGLVLLNMDALVANSEISNCASYCVYCSGGNHTFVHTTVASYFGYTNVRIQSAAKENAAAVYIDNLGKAEPHTTTSFYNCIITGYLPNQLVVATPLDRYYPGEFIGNYLKTDTLSMPHADANVYWQKTDTAQLFRNDYYKYKEYVYYDFRLDSLSPAIGIGDASKAESYPTDRNGVSRAEVKPDAGCYQHLP